MMQGTMSLKQKMTNLIVAFRNFGKTRKKIMCLNIILWLFEKKNQCGTTIT